MSDGGFKWPEVPKVNRVYVAEHWMTVGENEYRIETDESSYLP